MKEKRKYNIPNRKENKITVYLDDELKKLVDNHKKQTRRGYGIIIRQLLREYFFRLKKINKQ